MTPASPFVLVVSGSDAVRRYVHALLRPEGLETRDTFTPEEAFASLRPPAGPPRPDPVLLIDAALLGASGPRGDAWGRLVREKPEIRVVCLRRSPGERAPPALADRVGTCVEPMDARGLLAALRGAPPQGSAGARSSAAPRGTS